MRRVDAPIRPADDAVASGDCGALSLGCRHRGGPLQRRAPLQLLSGAQLGAPAKRCALHQTPFTSVPAAPPRRRGAPGLLRATARARRPPITNSASPRQGAAPARSARAPALPRIRPPDPDRSAKPDRAQLAARDPAPDSLGVDPQALGHIGDLQELVIRCHWWPPPPVESLSASPSPMERRADVTAMSYRASGGEVLPPSRGFTPSRGRPPAALGGRA